MDPSIFLQYSPPSGLPQESKLATYMNHSATTPPRSLNQALGKLSLDSSPTAIKKCLVPQQVLLDYSGLSYYQANLLPESPESSPPSTLLIPPPTPHVHQENVGGTTYFYSTNAEGLNVGAALSNANSLGVSEACLGGGVGLGPAMGLGLGGAAALAVPMVSPYASQIYAVTPAHICPVTTKPGLATTFYSPETIMAEIYERNEDVFLMTDMRQYPDLPENVEMYSQLTPLENASPHSMSTSFRATHRSSNDYYALRRLHAYANVPSKRLEIWKQIDHPNIVRLHDCFTTKAFGDHSLVLVYDYHPKATTLLNKFLTGANTSSDGAPTFHDPFSSDPDAPRPYTHQKNAMLRAVASGALLPEAVLWSLLVQLTAALRAIHSAGLACRTLDPTKVVVNGCRVRIAWCGLADTVHTNTVDIGQAQQDDLTALGRLALSLACRTYHCDNLPASMDLVARTYSADLKNLILYLLSSSPARRSVTDLMPMIGARFYTQVEALQRRNDAFETQLAYEVDNGRLLRLLIKMGVVNERPELNMDASWSETGNRYMLKLFRDYMFHSVDENGRPWLDQAHLAHCLNQLDGGTQEKVELMSRDEQSVLVVSYAELKYCLEQAYNEVVQATSDP